MNINSSNVGSLKKQTTFSFNYASIRNSLKKLRSLKSFIIYILPISLLLGLVFPEASESLNSLGLSLIQLISFPAIPLVLAAVVLSTHSILTISKSQKSKYNFTRRLFLTLITIVIFVSLFALLLALYQKPGILSPDGKLSIGRYMLDVTDINLSLFTVNDGISDNFKMI